MFLCSPQMMLLSVCSLYSNGRHRECSKTMLRCSSMVHHSCWSFFLVTWSYCAFPVAWAGLLVVYVEGGWCSYSSQGFLPFICLFPLLPTSQPCWVLLHCGFLLGFGPPLSDLWKQCSCASRCPFLHIFSFLSFPHLHLLWSLSVLFITVWSDLVGPSLILPLRGWFWVIPKELKTWLISAWCAECP